MEFCFLKSAFTKIIWIFENQIWFRELADFMNLRQNFLIFVRIIVYPGFGSLIKITCYFLIFRFLDVSFWYACKGRGSWGKTYRKNRKNFCHLNPPFFSFSSFARRFLRFIPKQFKGFSYRLKFWIKYLTFALMCYFECALNLIYIVIEKAINSIVVYN